MEVRFEINNRAELRQLLDIDNDDSKDNQVHTNRELALMLSGSKPLAAFVDVHPSVDGAFGIPEREFEPHIASGLIVKRDVIEPPSADERPIEGLRRGTPPAGTSNSPTRGRVKIPHLTAAGRGMITRFDAPWQGVPRIP